MNDIIHGGLDDPLNLFQGVRDHLPLLPSTIPRPAGVPSAPLETMESDQQLIPVGDPNLDEVCAMLQSKLKLNPEHLSIALLTSKCTPKARHANVIFALAAFHQLSLAARSPLVAEHVYNDRFKDFVQTRAYIILMNLALEAYSNNPHRNGTLPRTLYFLTFQPANWKEDHLPAAQLQDDPAALEHYWETVGELLKHQ
ncbi:hypothetical protein PtB15_14B337 [Puccinia triticina]|nr:hypothetical protein PtB15_14B337 [Puccinia triticina]